MASLYSLPVELILRVYDFLDPSTHFDFAMASRQIARQSHEILKHHRQCHQSYSTIDSPSKGSFNDLYNAITTDSIAAWHVRKLSLHDHQSCANENKSAQERIKLDSKVDEWLCDVVRHLPISSSDRMPCSKADLLSSMRKFFEKANTVAKQTLIIIARCSKLSLLKLDYSEELEKTLEASDDPLKKSPQLMGDLACRLHGLDRLGKFPMTIWPPGFTSISKVHLNGSGECDVLPATAAAFFLLPCVSAIRITNLDVHSGAGQNNLHSQFPVRWSERCSNVQHVFFDGARGDEMADILCELMRFCKKLSTVVFRECNFWTIDHIVDALTSFHWCDLQALLFVGDNTYSYFKWAWLERVRDLRALAVDVLSMMPAGTRRSAVEQQYAGETHEQFVQRFLQGIPESVETLILRPSSGQRLNDEEMLRVGGALLCLIDDPQHRLRRIYADDFETKMRDLRCTWGKHTDGGWFQKVKSHGEANGVRVYAQDDPQATERYIKEGCGHFFGQ